MWLSMPVIEVCQSLYDAVHTAAASRNSSVISKSLVMVSTLAFSGILVQNVGIPISVRIIASIS